MFSIVLIALPLLLAGIAWRIRQEKALYLLLIGGMLCNSILTGYALLHREQSCFQWEGARLLYMDEMGAVLIGITALLFLLAAIYMISWMPLMRKNEKPQGEMQLHCIVTLLFALLGTMTLVFLAYNFGLLWVAVEATTLASAPLILMRRSRASLEAMWKYILICSVGIGLALFGTMLAASALPIEIGEKGGLFFDTMKNASNSLHPGWFKAAFIFVLAGYGTKLGLAPFHTWLPDTYSQSTAPIAALLAGGLVNCSFLAVYRFWNIVPPQLTAFCKELLIVLGVLSLFVAAFFMIRQNEYHRLFAYSSIEHMGLAVLMLAVGMPELTQIHLAGHALCKMLLFLMAGNILMGYQTRSVTGVTAMFETMPRNAVLLLIGLFCICGTPPSPLFLTEFLLVSGCPFALGLTILLLLFAVFGGMSYSVLCMTMGTGSRPLSQECLRDGESLVKIPILLTMLIVGYGLFLLLGQSVVLGRG